MIIPSSFPPLGILITCTFWYYLIYQVFYSSLFACLLAFYISVCKVFFFLLMLKLTHSFISHAKSTGISKAFFISFPMYWISRVSFSNFLSFSPSAYISHLFFNVDHFLHSVILISFCDYYNTRVIGESGSDYCFVSLGSLPLPLPP